MTDDERKPLPHTWTRDGERVLAVKAVELDGSSYNGFKWPLTVGAEVEAPDWNGTSSCGGGLHIWPWGLHIGDGKGVRADMAWLVVSIDPQDIVAVGPDDQGYGGKAKCRRCRIHYVGDMAGAMYLTSAGRIALIHARSNGSASASGDRGSASASGKRGIASITGEYATIDIGANGLGAVTANRFYWQVRKGAVIVQRWQDDHDAMHHAIFEADTLPPDQQQSRPMIEDGQIVTKWGENK